MPRKNAPQKKLVPWGRQKSKLGLPYSFQLGGAFSSQLECVSHSIRRIIRVYWELGILESWQIFKFSSIVAWKISVTNGSNKTGLLSTYPYSVNIMTVTVIILFIFHRQVSYKNFSYLFCIRKNALVKFNENEQQDVECSECEIEIKDSVN